MSGEMTQLGFEEVAGRLFAEKLTVMQINLGRYCNQACIHCHVEASPLRQEMMSWEIMEHIICVLKDGDLKTVELTGGAPELHPHFETLVNELSSLGIKLLVRTNLTALMEPGKKDLPSFLHKQGVHLAASLPCYQEENVRKQRGDGVFSKSICALRLLNTVGYGTEGGLSLTLVYNPAGPFLPGRQKDLEDIYREELRKMYGITFTGLIALANMPIGRFRQDLLEKNIEEEYLNLLRNSFNRSTVERVMCRTNISVDWDGTLYDCDFNLAKQIPVNGTPSHINKFSRCSFEQRMIATDNHCFGCTAGSGSSCHGALEEETRCP
jgi:radical SAM/Cys-rich protein